MRFRHVLPVPALAVLLLGTACASRSILELRGVAGTMEGKTVRVKGQVTDTLQLPFSAKRFYKLSDGTGELWISTEDALPAKGDKLVVSGELHNAAVLDGAALGIRVQESGRHKAWF